MDAPSHLLLSSLQTLFGGHMDLNVRVLSREASVWFMSIRMEEVEEPKLQIHTKQPCLSSQLSPSFCYKNSTKILIFSRDYVWDMTAPGDGNASKQKYPASPAEGFI